jgi:NifB/MoaA-like Fe-S oxidoreductase
LGFWFLGMLFFFSGFFQTPPNAPKNPAQNRPKNPQAPTPNPQSSSGTILTGEMFAPIFREQIDKFNAIAGTRIQVLAVPNTYFGGDVAVAGLLTGQDYRNVVDQIKGDFVIIPKNTIKSDEPILLDGMMLDDLKKLFDVPVYDMDVNDLIEFLATRI